MVVSVYAIAVAGLYSREAGSADAQVIEQFSRLSFSLEGGNELAPCDGLLVLVVKLLDEQVPRFFGQLYVVLQFFCD